MTISDLTGATILRVYHLAAGSFILVTDQGTVSAVGVSNTQVVPNDQVQQRKNLW
jgi:hypothetical protein